MQFLAVMVSEAEQVSNDVFKSISELKELLAFSADQQEVVSLYCPWNTCKKMQLILKTFLADV